MAFHVSHALIGNLPPCEPACFDSVANAVEYAAELLTEVAECLPDEPDPVTALASLHAASAAEVARYGWTGYVGRVGYHVEPVEACDCAELDDCW